MVYRRFCRDTLQWSGWAVGVASIGVALVLAGCGGATAVTTDTTAPAASSGFHIVPVTGTVAGGGYGTWLQRSWQLPFSRPTFSVCATAEFDGQRVGLLGVEVPSSKETACAEPLGRPLYVAEASFECSSFPGNHGKFGPDDGAGTLTSGTQLEACARAQSKGTTMSATVDGRSVNLAARLVTTKVFPIDVVADNSIGLSDAGHAVAAACGGGILVSGLTAGTHVIQVNSTLGSNGATGDYTFTVHVA